MENFRIAIGACSCASFARTRNRELQELCRRVLVRVSELNAKTPEELSALPSSSQEVESIASKSVWFGTYRDELPAERGSLIVVQGFLPSWRFPRYFGPAGIGFIVAEGLVACAGRPNEPAPDALLWEFR